MSKNGKVVSIVDLDLQRYTGRWYEICRLPIKWEDVDASDITATYTRNEDGTLRVDNRCIDATGKPSQAVGRATPIDSSKARLKVNFLPNYLNWLPFTSGDYWVLKIDPGYATVLVGTPDRKYLWILARSADVAADVVDMYLEEARRQGFDLSELITPRHTGREVTDAEARFRDISLEPAV